MSAILQIGEDEFLLETRAAVLRTTGAAVVSAEISSALSVLERQVFDIVILCHTIPEPVSRTLADVVHQNWPVTRLLQISVIREWEQSGELEGLDLCPPDPERLIEHIIELLGRRSPGSVRTPISEPSPRITAVR
jgi:hypothetical protein